MEQSKETKQVLDMNERIGLMMNKQSKIETAYGSDSIETIRNTRNVPTLSRQASIITGLTTAVSETKISEGVMSDLHVTLQNLFTEVVQTLCEDKLVSQEVISEAVETLINSEGDKLLNTALKTLNKIQGSK